MANTVALGTDINQIHYLAIVFLNLDLQLIATQLKSLPSSLVLVS